MSNTVCIIYIILTITLSVKTKICLFGQLKVALQKNTKQEGI